MSKIQLHSCFRLNGEVFPSVAILLKRVKNNNSMSMFLQSWFSSSNFIEVQTSGSTGKPKTIRLAKIHMINSAIATGRYFKLFENTKALLCMSTDYIAGKMMLVRAMTLGWNIDVISPSAFIKTDANYDFVAMVPLQLRNSISVLDKFKKVIVGGGVVEDDLLLQIKNTKAKVFATYGMTETVTHIAIKKLNHISSYIENYYEVLSGVKILIDKRSCLLINAPKISSSYVQTNDIVSIVSDKHFQWLGRFDNVINSGGVKLHPEEIERKLSKRISCRFFVAGLPDKNLGQKLVLIVEGERESIFYEDLNLNKYEIPKEIIFIGKFIETETKKVHRTKTLALI